RLLDDLGQQLLGALPIRHGEGARDRGRGHLRLGRQEERRRRSCAWSAFLVCVCPLRHAFARLGRSRHLPACRGRLRPWRLFRQRWRGALDILLRLLPGPSPRIGGCRGRLRLWRLLSRRWRGALDILLRLVPGSSPGIVLRRCWLALASERLSLGLRFPVQSGGWRRWWGGGRRRSVNSKGVAFGPW